MVQGHQGVIHKTPGTNLQCVWISFMHLEMKMWPCEVPQADQLGCSFIEARVSKCQKEKYQCVLFVCFQCAEIGDFSKEEH